MQHGKAGGWIPIIRGFSPNAKLFLVSTFFGSMNWSIFALVYNLYLYNLGFKQDFIGLLNGIPSIAVLLLGIPVSILAVRTGFRKLILIGSALAPLAALGIGLMSEPGWLFLFALLSGVASAFSWVISIPMLMENSTERDRIYLFSINFSLMMISGFGGSLLAGYLPEILGAAWGISATAVLPLRVTYLTTVLFGILAWIPILFMREVKPVSPRITLRSIRLVDPKVFTKLVLPQAIISLGAGAMVVFFQLFFNLRFNLAPGQIGILFALSSLVNGLIGLLSPALAMRWGKVRAVVYTELASLPFLVILAFSGNFALVVISYFIRAALMNMGSPLYTTFAMEQVKEEQRPTLNSLFAMVGSLGRGGLGPLISGYLQVGSGFSLAFSMTLLCYVVSSVMTFFFFRRSEPPISKPVHPGYNGKKNIEGR
jgi:MFS family permease